MISGVFVPNIVRFLLRKFIFFLFTLIIYAIISYFCGGIPNVYADNGDSGDETNYSNRATEGGNTEGKISNGSIEGQSESNGNNGYAENKNTEANHMNASSESDYSADDSSNQDSEGNA